jgi:hypothetical protein
MISVTPFFEFVLVAVNIGSLALLLTAVLLTARRSWLSPAASRRSGRWTRPLCVRDAKRQALPYVYFEDEPGRRMATHRLTPADRPQHRQAATTVPPVDELGHAFILSAIRLIRHQRCRA